MRTLLMQIKGYKLQFCVVLGESFWGISSCKSWMPSQEQRKWMSFFFNRRENKNKAQKLITLDVTEMKAF